MNHACSARLCVNGADAVLFTNMHSARGARREVARSSYKVAKLATLSEIGVDRYVFFRADADTDYYRSSRPITDIFNRYTCLV